MVILFTSNTGGGIVQFTIQLLTTLIDMGEEALAFVPEGANYTLDEKDYPYIHNYLKVKTLFIKDKRILNIVYEISKYKPNTIIFTDNDVISLQILLNLHNNTKSVLCFHDIIPHPSYISLRNILFNKVKSMLKRIAINKSEYILLLSENSRRKFQAVYKGVNSKRLLVLPLGAHVPLAEVRKPPEIDSNISGYYLFFGRFDKYKGIYKLIEAYNKLPISNKPRLIIAGNGVLSQEESTQINENTEIFLIKRFIKDEEMIYLYRNSRAVILPYIEASQSGVLAMSYHFNLPVVVMNLPGLTEFVEHEKTGYICDSINDLIFSLLKLTNEKTINDMKVSIKNYYMNNLCWSKNVTKILKIINEFE